MYNDSQMVMGMSEQMFVLILVYGRLVLLKLFITLMKKFTLILLS